MILRSPALCAAFAFLASASDLLTLETESNNTLLWGPYRPNLYFGVRPRIPESLSLGLLWARVEDYNSVQENFRYTCEQDSSMGSYGWESYDARSGGVQSIHDKGNEIDITTSFFKDASGDKGGNWGVRIRGVPREGAKKDLKTTVVVNVNLEGKYGVFSNLEVKRPVEAGEGDTDWFKGDVVLEGETPGLGGFRLEVKGDEGTENKHPVYSHPSYAQKSLDRTLVNSKVLAEDTIWQSKRTVSPLLSSSFPSSNSC
jgi:mannosyl-oligosaccharide glucosidase